MTEYISDSEEEADSSHLIISPDLLEDNLHILSPTKRHTTRDRLRPYLPTRTEPIEEEAIPISASVEPSESLTTDLERAEHTQLDEDNHHLQTYINSRTTTRRGLRKRNFASTHPYLSDQAHYLGLCDISYLNELYDDNNQNLDIIVKYLNYNYMKMKERYRGDEKFRHKNFYTILGKGLSHLREENQGDAYQETQQQEEENEDSIMGFMNDLFSDSEQESYSQSEEELEPVPANKHHSLIIDEEEDEEEQDSDDDTLVRVGGRFRKERSILRGTLPESAKRLSIYKPTTRKARTTPKHIDYRKGMAVRKSVQRHRPEPEFNIVDDTITYDTFNELYHELYTDPTEGTPDLEMLESESMYDAVLLSESSSSDNESVDSDIFMRQDDQPNIAPDFMSDDEVQERDTINMMLATGERRNRPKKHRSIQSTLPGYSRSASTPRKQGESRSYLHARVRSRERDGYSRLQVKPISKPKTSRRNKQKVQKKHKTIDKYLTKNPKDLFSDYLFSRQPVFSTTTIEAESETRFVKEPFHGETRNNTVNPLSKSLLQNIDLSKIIELAKGKSYTLTKDTVCIVFLNVPYTLSLVDIQNSITTNEKLLTHLAKTIKTFNVPLELFSQGLTECIKGLIEWALVIQKSFTTKEWKLLDICYNSLVKSVVIPLSFKLEYMPYFMLLYYTVSNIALFQGGSPVDLDEFVKRYAQSYWKLYFESWSIYESVNVDESFKVHCLLVGRSLWWESIVSVLDNYVDSPNSIHILEALFQLCCNCTGKGYSWTPFSSMFDKSHNSSSFCYRYIEMMYTLNQRKDWPIDEKMILQIYHSITSRKFANFNDEVEVPDLLGRIRTRYDIPDGTFFERFMQFLYWYVSGISSGQTVKRLITKLFISSKFQYVNDKSHQVMFINRLNFIVLLAQLSTSVDLTNQICELFESIEQSKDVDCFKLGVNSLIVICQVATSTQGKLPINAIILFIKYCIDNFFTIPGVFKLWNRFIHIFKDKIIKHLTSGQMIQVLAISKGLHIDMPDAICMDLLDMFSRISPPSCMAKTVQGLVDLLEGILHRQMGRIPLPSLQEETRVSTIVESCIANWIKFSSLLPNYNWEKLVLQTFPYTGNHTSRDKFSIYFYYNVLKYHNLKGCQEVVTRCVIRELMLYNPSNYLSSILTLLDRDKWSVFVLKTQVDVKHLVQQSRHIIVNNIIDNLLKLKMSNSEKFKYIMEIQKTVNSEFDKYYSCTWYKEFVVRVIKYIQIQGTDILDNTTSSLISSLSSKLGISQSELSQYKIHKLPLLDKLRMFHVDFINAVHFHRDVLEILDRFVTDVELLYHLLSIYLEVSHWKLIYELLKYFDTNVRLLKMLELKIMK
ncbi:hypothetical protein JA1_004095 [Spathaspora sp. JA1]|nr:hypothetical protein JA1_004095 [Spathaspora sp. JA1]